ncbi:hypothetical protein PQO01_16905 [Lentisphaera marina]|uniref:hypothetical protein n=1 Tax=Lentisphaera marina TaxID=1111041 RepID=UPI002366CA1F|nr:hypothetical protein [Lentisphaera marina]MDD7986633.1 hypothetical protein [Lentisphaera marina]
MKRVIPLVLYTVLLLLCSCTQIHEMPIEGENWKQSGDYQEHSWSVVKEGDTITIHLDDMAYQVAPQIKIQGLSIERCGLASSGPASQDHGIELAQYGKLYHSKPYAHSFKIDKELHIFSLSKEQTSEGILYIQSIFSIDLETKEISLQEIINNPNKDIREAQFSYLIKSEEDLKVFPNYNSVSPLHTDQERDLSKWQKDKNLSDMNALNYANKSDLILSQKDTIFSISRKDLKHVSLLNPTTLSLGTSLYQKRQHERILGRVVLLKPYTDLKLSTCIKISSELPTDSRPVTYVPKLDGLESLEIK